METTTFDHPKSIAAAIGVLDRHLAALNAGDASALAQTLHFPHYRLAGSRMTIWEGSETYLQDFHARAGGEWHHSAWDFRRPISASAEKVHLDVQTALAFSLVDTAQTARSWVGIAPYGS